MTEAVKLFIPENFLGKTAIITHVPGKGWGLLIDRTKLGEAIKEGRVKHTVLHSRCIQPIDQTPKIILP